jgi:hypothetical protein
LNDFANCDTAAKARIQSFQQLLDSGIRRSDVIRTFYEAIKSKGKIVWRCA